MDANPALPFLEIAKEFFSSAEESLAKKKNENSKAISLLSDGTERLLIALLYACGIEEPHDFKTFPEILIEKDSRLAEFREFYPDLLTAGKRAKLSPAPSLKETEIENFFSPAKKFLALAEKIIEKNS
jgi:HEPN domain-containing protein